MNVPIGFDEFSLWMAVSAITLLITSEIVNQYHSQIGLVINKNRLKTASRIQGFLFLIIIVIYIFQLVITPVINRG